MLSSSLLNKSFEAKSISQKLGVQYTTTQQLINTHTYTRTHTHSNAHTHTHLHIHTLLPLSLSHTLLALISRPQSSIEIGAKDIKNIDCFNLKWICLQK